MVYFIGIVNNLLDLLGKFCVYVEILGWVIDCVLVLEWFCYNVDGYWLFNVGIN